METYRKAAPHRIHVLSFVEGVTPASLLVPLRERFGVTKLPSVVFDGHAMVDGCNAMVVAGTLDRCLWKPPAHLSMELHGSVIASQFLSLGFIMCNHGSSTEMRGTTTSFVYEDGVTLDGWTCDRVVREQLDISRPYAIAPGKCQPPTMLKWKICPGVESTHAGALLLIMDQQGHVIDSICTEKPCTRTGICG